MRLEEIMTAGVVGVREDASIGEARDRMAAFDIHALPVTDRHGMLVGIVSSEDLLRGHEPTLPVSRVMTSPVQTLQPSSGVEEAVALMRKYRRHHIVVTDGQKIAGMVSSFDLLGLLEG